jgi:hypothetical protein
MISETQDQVSLPTFVLVSGSAFDIVRQPKADGVTWAWAQSDLDMASESTARAELAEVLDGHGAAAVLLVYLGPECFVDVRGLRLLLDASERLRKRVGTAAEAE